MSRAIAAFGAAGRDSSAASPTSTPIGSDLHLNIPRKSVDATAVAQNYRRRLSLAVPERPKFQRDRSPSDVTQLRSLNNQEKQQQQQTAKKRRFFRRGHSYHGEEREKESKNSVVNQLSRSPSKHSKTSGFESITEHDEESGHSLDDTRSTASSVSTGSGRSQKHRRPKLQKSKTIDLGKTDSTSIGSVRRSETDPSKHKDRTKVKFDIEDEMNISNNSRSKCEDTSSTGDTKDQERTSEDLAPNQQLRKASYTQAVSNENEKQIENIEMDDVENTHL